MSKDAVKSAVDSLKWVYAVVIALSISEAFVQFALASGSGCPEIHWDRVLSLVAFLALVVPFYHGMSRHFWELYMTEEISPHYGCWLLMDCCTFTVEAGFFFVLARTLSNDVWQQFNKVIILLLFWDVLWGAFVWKFRRNSISSWVIVNLCTIPILGVVLLWFQSKNPWWGVSFVCVVVLARTVADYWTGWAFYFPKVSNASSSVVS